MANYSNSNGASAGSGQTISYSNNSYSQTGTGDPDQFSVNRFANASNGGSATLNGDSVTLDGGDGDDGFNAGYSMNAQGTASSASATTNSLNIAGGAGGDSFNLFVFTRALNGGSISVEGNQRGVSGGDGFDTIFGDAQIYSGLHNNTAVAGGTTEWSDNVDIFDVGAGGGNLYHQTSVGAYQGGTTTYSGNRSSALGGDGTDSLTFHLKAHAGDSFYGTSGGSSTISGNQFVFSGAGGGDSLSLTLHSSAHNGGTANVVSNSASMLGEAGNDNITIFFARDTSNGGTATSSGNIALLDGGADSDSVTANFDAGTANNSVQIKGGSGNDTLNSTDNGDNDRIFVGGAGSDTIRDYSGFSTAVFSGARGDYDVDDLGGGWISVTDLRSGSLDGADQLYQVDQLRFADGDYVVDGDVFSEPPSLPTDSDGVSGATVAESLAVGSAVGITATSIDADAETVSYSLGFEGDGDPILDDGQFAIDASTGVVTLSAALDYERQASYTLRIYASDGTASSYSDFTVNVSNVTEHLFTIGDDTVDFNSLPDGSYDLDGAQYTALAGDDVVTLPNLATVDTGNPWDFDQTFMAGDGNDFIVGGDGDDRIDGGIGHDLLVSLTGNDRLQGGDGDDYLSASSGDDLMDGGAGLDRANFTSSLGVGVTVDLNLQGLAQNTGHGMDTLIGIEHVSGTRFNDVITGDAGDNWLWGGGDGSGVTGNDTISAAGGNDLVQVGTGNHTLDGGSGNDTLSFNGNGTDITSAGVAVLLALQGTGQNTQQGLMTLAGFENLSGSPFDDLLAGNSGANVLAGYLGNDALNGGAGNDTLYGDGEIAVDSHGLGGSGPFDIAPDVTAVFALTPGNDRLEGGLGNDYLDGGRGTDTAWYANATGGVTVNLATGTATGADGSDTLFNMENVNGSAHNDVIIGDTGANEFIGGGGNDRLVGMGGGDRLTGFSGADRFVFTLVSDSPPGAPDTITDFSGKGNPKKSQAGQGDIIDLSAIDANVNAAGDQAFALAKKFTGLAGQAYSSYDAGTNTTSLLLDVNGDAAADMTILLTGQVTLNGADYIL